MGAGSGGIGAALAAARMGARVLLAERAPTIGGTVVRAGVSTWEPVAGATGLPFEIYLRLCDLGGGRGRPPSKGAEERGCSGNERSVSALSWRAGALAHGGRSRPTSRGDAVALYSYGRHMAWQRPGDPPFPGGEHIIDPSLSYLDTLQRHGMRSLREDAAWARATLHGVVFEPDAYAAVVGEMLREAGVEVLTGVGVIDAEVRDGRVQSVRLSDGSEMRARAFIDCTGDGALCAMCGCEMMAGCDARERFGEPHAPDAPSPATNAATLIYRVMPTDEEGTEPLPTGIPEQCWWRERFPAVSAVQAPRGGYIMNMLPTIEWRELAAPGGGLYEECRRRVLAHWHHVQREFPEFRRYRLARIAPEVGLREQRRVVGDYVLTERDLLAGLSGQDHPDIIAIADHAMDLHGEGGGCRELAEPYGIPLRCLIPRGLGNLLVASRAASFSSIAASSCRLSRTMLQLGQAAGTAAGLALAGGCGVRDLAPDDLRQALRARRVQLEWPIPQALRAEMQRAEAGGLRAEPRAGTRSRRSPA